MTRQPPVQCSWGTREFFPLVQCMLCKKDRCYDRRIRNWCHDDGTAPRALETLKLASAWCTPADADNLRTASKDWYDAFEHTPDEATMTRIEPHDQITCCREARPVLTTDFLTTWFFLRNESAFFYLTKNVFSTLLLLLFFSFMACRGNGIVRELVFTPFWCRLLSCVTPSTRKPARPAVAHRDLAHTRGMNPRRTHQGNACFIAACASVPIFFI